MSDPRPIHASELPAAVGIDASLGGALLDRVRNKLETGASEALCIDFEDGYGVRSDEEEDADAIRAAKELAATSLGRAQVGIRIKPIANPRARRTLDLFMKHVGAVPSGFTVTLPKVASAEEVATLASVLDANVPIELMVETPRALLDPRGSSAIPALIDAGRGRVVALHLGAYDLTAELGVTAQRLDHPLCDLARMLMKLAVHAYDPSIGISDGATTVLPIEPNVASGWALHAANVRRALDVGIWQGWDLHPAQLPARYGAVFAHFLERKEAMAAWLCSFVENESKATRLGQTFDDEATGRGLRLFFQRGVACGALHKEET